MINFAKIIWMDSSFSQELIEMSRKIEILAAQRDEARSELAKAREEISDLKGLLAIAEEDLHKKSLDVEFLTLSRKLADTPQALAEARATMKRILGKVDHALMLLKEDAGI